MKSPEAILRNAKEILFDIPSAMAQSAPESAASLIKAFGYLHKATGAVDLREWAKTADREQVLRAFDSALGMATRK